MYFCIAAAGFGYSIIKLKSRAKDKWGSETEGHKTNGEVDKMDSTNIEVRIFFVCMSCLLH